MRVRTQLLPSVGAVGVLLFGAPTGLARESIVPRGGENSGGRAAEVQRIRLHFDSVLVELRGRDVASLSDRQRERRATLIATLEAYRDRGWFPRNYDFPGQLVPYFVDRRTGVLCAVAHLLESTGRRDIVNRVARTNNNVWVAEFAPDSALGSWLAAHGLTLDEASRIQVPYDEDAPESAALGVAAATGGAVVMSAWNATVNRRGKGKVGTFLGVAFGVAALGATSVAGSASGDGFGPGPLVTLAAGSLSTGLAIRGVLRQRRLEAARRATVPPAITAQKEPVQTTLAPTISTDGQAGVVLRVRF
jgi:hypothetical protein